MITMLLMPRQDKQRPVDGPMISPASASTSTGCQFPTALADARFTVAVIRMVRHLSQGIRTAQRCLKITLTPKIWWCSCFQSPSSVLETLGVTLLARLKALCCYFKWVCIQTASKNQKRRLCADQLDPTRNLNSQCLWH